MRLPHMDADNFFAPQWLVRTLVVLLFYAFATLAGCGDDGDASTFACDETVDCTDSERSVCDLYGECPASDLVPGTCIRPSEACWQDGGTADAGPSDASGLDAQ